MGCGSSSAAAAAAKPDAKSQTKPPKTVSRDQYRAALNTSLDHPENRNLKAAVLGRKSAGEIFVSATGFSATFVHICEGQVVTFRWDEPDGNGLSIVQTVHDGYLHKPVIGGFNSGKASRSGVYECQFNHSGEYLFACGGHKINPLTVLVDPRKDVEVTVSDDGFKPKVVRIDEGNAINWSWLECSKTHSVTEATFSHSLGMFHKAKSSANSRSVALPTKSGSFRKDFIKPGLYYFQTESAVKGQPFTCIVHVRERQREYKVKVKDTRFDPQILLIEEGDRVWWEWKKEQCEAMHCVYEVALPRLGDANTESFKYKENGFKWSQPSKSGLLAHEFFVPGIYYFSDQTLNETAGYFGTIIVKPRVVETFIDLTPDGFYEELLGIGMGERLWWTWICDEFNANFKITEICKTLAGAATDNENNTQQSDGYMDAETERIKFIVGKELAQPPLNGVYHYCMTGNEQSSKSTCSVIVNHFTKNHTVYVSDKGIEPSIVSVNLGDRVWWIWQDGRRSHNVVQVTHSGKVMEGGFCSGVAVQPPSAFVYQFNELGAFYYRSDADKTSFGAVVVSTPPRVHVVKVESNGEIFPDVQTVRVNDVVAWTFDSPMYNDVHLLSQPLSELENTTNIQALAGDLVSQRRCMNRAFNERGMFHFVSNSFSPLDGIRVENADGVPPLLISTVLVDDVSDNFLIRLDKNGFYPDSVTVKKGASVLWSWVESGEELHNIVRVDPSDVNASMDNKDCISSGEAASKSTFMHSFDEAGEYAFISDGASGPLCKLSVVESDVQTQPPFIVSGCDGGPVDRSHVVFLSCDTPGAEIFYTTDGSAPQLHLPYIKTYNHNVGIELTPDASEICVIRAVAVAPGVATSEVFTSRRFLMAKNKEKEELKRWNEFLPRLQVRQTTTVNEMNVIWDAAPDNVLELLENFQVFLNGVSYGPRLEASSTGIRVLGIAGGRNYDIMIEAYPKNENFPARQSNTLSMTVPTLSHDGGPLISLERTSRPNSMSIVWRPIPGAAAYQLYFNGEKCGPKVASGGGTERCKVTIEDCKLNSIYKVLVTAIPTGSEPDKLSNELTVSLPLKVDDIILPAEARKYDTGDVQDSTLVTSTNTQAVMENDELIMYREYLEVMPLVVPVPETSTLIQESIPQGLNEAKQNQELGQEGATSSHELFEEQRCPEVVLDLVASTLSQQEHLEHLEKTLALQSQETSRQVEVTVVNSGQTEVSVTQNHDLICDNSVAIASTFVTESDNLVVRTPPGDRIQQSQPEQVNGIANSTQIQSAQLQLLLEQQLKQQREELELSFLQRQTNLEQQVLQLQKQITYQQQQQQQQQQHQQQQQQQQRETQIHNELQQLNQQANDRPFVQIDGSEVDVEIYVDETGRNAENWSTNGELSARQNWANRNEQSSVMNTSSVPSVLSPAASGAEPRLLYEVSEAGFVATDEFTLDASRAFQLVQGNELPSNQPESDKKEWKKSLLRRAGVASMFGSGQRSQAVKPSNLDEQEVPLIPGNGLSSLNEMSRGRNVVMKDGLVLDASRDFQPLQLSSLDDRRARMIAQGVHETTLQQMSPEHSYGLTTGTSQQQTTPGSSLTLKQMLPLKQMLHAQNSISLRIIGADNQYINNSVDTSGPMTNVAVIKLNEELEQGSGLPLPIIKIETTDVKEIYAISWKFPHKPDPMYSQLSHMVSVVGEAFDNDTNSNLSFNCMTDVNGHAVPAKRHCWNAKLDNCRIRGLLPRVTYSAQVESTFVRTNVSNPLEIRVKSEPVKFTLEELTGQQGFLPLQLFVNKRDNCQIGFSWNVNPVLVEKIAGFQPVVNGNPVGRMLPKTASRHFAIDKLHPGQTLDAYVAALTSSNIPVGSSNIIKVTCPNKPPAPIVKEQPSFRKGSVIIGWERPTQISLETLAADEITDYRVFLDGKWYGDVEANPASDRTCYQYCLPNLTAGQTYDINVKAVRGGLKNAEESSVVNNGFVKSNEENAQNGIAMVYCPCESDMSATLSVTCPPPLPSPTMRIEDMHDDGVDVIWEMPQQNGDEAVMGYQMLKNGKPYGDIIPPDIQSMRVKDLLLGEKTELQIIALAKRGHRSSHAVNRSISNNSFEGSAAGPKLIIGYTGLVEAPYNVYCELVTGHSADIRWETARRPRDHFVLPDSYQVTWWPGNRPVTDISSQSTTDDHIQIKGLRPSTAYTVVVEARKLHKYERVNEVANQDDGFNNTFIMASKSDPILIETAFPPEPPANLAICSTSCNSIILTWDPPKELGVPVIGLRVDAVPARTSDVEDPYNQQVGLISFELPADATSTIIDGLAEKTEYSISVFAFTEEYFNETNGGLGSQRTLQPGMALPRSVWLPTSTIVTMTSGTDPPSDVHIVKELPDSIRLAWTPARTYGSNRLLGAVVRWAESKTISELATSDHMARYRSLQADCNGVVIDGLDPGISYRFIIEAVVSVRMTVEQGQPGAAVDSDSANRRTTHVLSKPVTGRTRAPCEPPRPIVTGYTTSTIQLYWNKPLLEIVTGPRHNEISPRYVKLSPEGYRLEINGRPHMRLSAGTQQCTLVKCRAGKTYNIALVALTCPKDVKNNMQTSANERDTEVVTCQEWRSMPEDDENDESQSIPVMVTLPALEPGGIAEMSSTYLWSTGVANNDDGNVQVGWSVQDGDVTASAAEKPVIRQFNVSWNNNVDEATREMFLEPHITKCLIPASRRGVVYNVTVKPQYETPRRSGGPPTFQCVQCLIPGSPNAPNIWTRYRRPEADVTDDEAVIEWSEPRLHGVKISGYQIYLNGNKTGGPLSSKYHKAIVQLKGKRVYRIGLKALSVDSRVADSEMSNTLVFNEPLSDQGQQGGLRAIDLLQGQSAALAVLLGEDTDTGDGFPVKVIRLTDASIHLDWSQYHPHSTLVYYRVVWSSASSPAVREVRLPARERSCVLHKCYPGTYHNIRVYAVGAEDALLGRSRRLTVQTSAPPEPPSVTIRTVNFNFISVEWAKPISYGDAAVCGYKVYVNGIVETQLSAEEKSFDLTGGVPCKDYVFQVQALSSVEKFHSRLSDPVVVTWPGILAPILHATPVASGVMKLSWQPSFLTKGITIKHYVVIILDAVSKQKLQTLIVKDDAQNVDVLDLRTGTSYMASIQVHIYESAQVVESDWLEFQPIICADPPHITVAVVGLDDRRQLEHEVSNAINKRDRLLSLVAKDSNSVADLLSQTDSLLDDYLSRLDRQYTGFILAHVSWSCRQSNAGVEVTGFQVMVNGKKYGSVLDVNINSLRIKIAIGRPSHQICLLAVYEALTDIPAPSRQLTVESNTVELTGDSFIPFAFYSFLSQFPRGGNGESATAEQYTDTLVFERRRMLASNGSRVPVNEGLLVTGVPVPHCAAMDAMTGEYRPLKSRSSAHAAVRPTALFFWSPRSRNSQKYLGWFVKFAKSHVSQCECIAVACCEPRMIGITDRQNMVSLIVEHGWRDDSCIQHITSNALSKTDSSSHLHGGDLCTMFGINGVPSVAILNPKGYIAWRGRYCAVECSAYEHFLLYILAQVMGGPVPNPDPWDTDFSMRDSLRRRLTSHESHSTSLPSFSGSSSGKKTQKLFSKSSTNRREPLTVNTRPFSATASPYDDRLARTAPPVQRGKSGRKSKSIY